MSTIQQQRGRTNALGLERVMVLGVIAVMVLVAAVFVVSQVGGSAAQIRACLNSPTACAGAGHDTPGR